jgi:hypothetical protein
VTKVAQGKVTAALLTQNVWCTGILDHLAEQPFPFFGFRQVGLDGDGRAAGWLLTLPSKVGRMPHRSD